MKTYGIDANALTIPQPTGVERYARQLIEQMMLEPLQEGERVLLYSQQPLEIELPVGWENVVLRWPWKLWTHGRLSAHMLRYAPDVLFSPAHEIPLITGSARVVYTVHDIAFRFFPETYGRIGRIRQEWAMRLASKRADKVLCVSQTTASDMQSVYGIANNNVQVTPLALIPRTKGAKHTYRLFDRLGIAAKRYVIAIGRLEEKKNTKRLIQAFVQFVQQTGSDIKLLLVGSVSDENIQEMLDRHADYVIHPGYVTDDELFALLEQARCMAFVSLYEGFGLPLLEAFDTNVPVLASDIPVFHEVADNAAMYVDPFNVERLAHGLAELTSNEGLQKQLVQRGSDRLMHFTWEQTAELTWKALREVMYERTAS